MTTEETETAPEGFNLDLEARDDDAGITFRQIVLEEYDHDDDTADTADGKADDDDDVMDDNPPSVDA